MVLGKDGYLDEQDIGKSQGWKQTHDESNQKQKKSMNSSVRGLADLVLELPGALGPHCTGAVRGAESVM